MSAHRGQCAILYCATLYELQIYLRMRGALARRGFPIRIVCHSFSVWIGAWLSGTPSHLLQPDRHAGTDHASRMASSVAAALAQACAHCDVAAIVQWNGLRSYGQAITAFARARGLPTVFLELGNLAPKLFVDPEGVNGASRLAREPEALDSYEINEEELAAFTAKLVETRQVEGLAPQSKLVTRVNPWFLVDYLGALILRIPQPEPVNILNKIRSKARLWRWQGPPAKHPSRPYVYFPLQVHNDTNLLYLSKYDNTSAYLYALGYAKERGLLLVVKPHPAEPDTGLVDSLEILAERDGALLTSAASAGLVAEAHTVITINSTVGLDAVLLERPLIVLGESYFSHFTRRRAAIFAMKHLVDFSPFGKEPMSDAAADRIVQLFK